MVFGKLTAEKSFVDTMNLKVETLTAKYSEIEDLNQNYYKQ